MKGKESLKIDNHAIHDNFGLVLVKDISKRFKVAKIEIVVTTMLFNSSKLTHIVPLETLSPNR